MSTRGVIARPTGTEGGFKGVYNHSCSYPTWLGPRLWKMLNHQYRGSVAAMLRYVIDQHSAGWSSVGQECYCHPQDQRKAEKMGQWFTEEDVLAVDTDIEWLWVFDEKQSRLHIRDVRHKADAGIVELAGPEPNWELIECGAELERCRHYAGQHFPEMKDSLIGTQTYLGRCEFTMRDAIAFIIDGRRYRATGGGGRSDWYSRGGKEPHVAFPPRTWIAKLEASNGRSLERPVAYIQPEGGYRPYDGVTWVFPPRKDNPFETFRQE